MTLRLTSIRMMKRTGARCPGFGPRRTDVRPTRGFAPGPHETAVTAQDHPRHSTDPRSGSRRPGSNRPREASRPKRPSSSSTGAASIRLCPATFVEISADQERHAIDALAELLVPLLARPHRESANADAPSDFKSSTGER